jgi:histidinol-phosphate transaminase
MEKNLNFLDRNEFNYSPSKEVVEALKNFDINKLCFYTRIYDEGKKRFWEFLPLSCSRTKKYGAYRNMTHICLRNMGII